MDRPPLISIIIPTLNASATLPDCMDSIIEQSFNEYELLVIDGGSMDSTLVVVQTYHPKINSLTVISEKDGGIYDAMNKGIKLAKGEYLYFLGSDDTLFDRDILSSIKKKIDETNAKVIYGNVIMRGSNQWVQDGLVHAGKFNLKRLLSTNICHQSIFYHRSVFEQLGTFNIKYKVFADHDFNLRCFANYDFFYTEIIIANFKVGGVSTSITDVTFLEDKDKNIVHYFFKKLFSSEFVDSRLYIKRVAFSRSAVINFGTRLYCLLAYAKLKTQSLLR